MSTELTFLILESEPQIGTLDTHDSKLIPASESNSEPSFFTQTKLPNL